MGCEVLFGGLLLTGACFGRCVECVFWWGDLLAWIFLVWAEDFAFWGV